VPQVLLRLHVNDPSSKRGTEQVWCFDKKTDKIFSPNIKGILSGSRFYEVEIDGKRISLEEPLTKVEEQVGPILARLVRDQKLVEIWKQERTTIAAFCAVQFVRTQVFRDRIKEMNEGVAEALRKRGIDPTQVSNFEVLSDDEIKAFSMKMLATAPQKFGPYFLQKYWHLVGATAKDPFHLGDHPVVLDNDLQRGGPATLGLASAGVTIYMPIAPTLCLAMTDPALMAELLAGARKVEAGYKKWKKRVSRDGFTARGVEFLGELRANRDKVKKQVEPIRRGTPSEYHPEVVKRVNSLQMMNAGRWIVSSWAEFGLPKQMIADDPAFRERRKMQVE
jgi:Protein of unknown function (DUF4238)